MACSAKPEDSSSVPLWLAHPAIPTERTKASVALIANLLLRMIYTPFPSKSRMIISPKSQNLLCNILEDNLFVRPWKKPRKEVGKASATVTTTAPGASAYSELNQEGRQMPSWPLVRSYSIECSHDKSVVVIAVPSNPMP